MHTTSRALFGRVVLHLHLRYARDDPSCLTDRNSNNSASIPFITQNVFDRKMYKDKGVSKTKQRLKQSEPKRKRINFLNCYISQQLRRLLKTISQTSTRQRNCQRQSTKHRHSRLHPDGLSPCCQWNYFLDCCQSHQEHAGYSFFMQQHDLRPDKCCFSFIFEEPFMNDIPRAVFAMYFWNAIHYESAEKPLTSSVPRYICGVHFILQLNVGCGRAQRGQRRRWILQSRVHGRQEQRRGTQRGERTTRTKHATLATNRRQRCFIRVLQIWKSRTVYRSPGMDSASKYGETRPRFTKSMNQIEKIYRFRGHK